MTNRPAQQEQFSTRAILRRIDRSEEALAAFRKAAELEPENSAVADAMGQLLLALGRREEAVRQFERSLELNPNQPEIREIIRRSKLRTSN